MTLAAWALLLYLGDTVTPGATFQTYEQCQYAIKANVLADHLQCAELAPA